MTAAAVSHCEIPIHSSGYSASPLNGILLRSLHKKTTHLHSACFYFSARCDFILLLVIFCSFTASAARPCLTELSNGAHLLVLLNDRKKICIGINAPQPDAHAVFSHLQGMDCYLLNRLCILWSSTIDRCNFLFFAIAQYSVVLKGSRHTTHRWKGAERA